MWLWRYQMVFHENKENVKKLMISLNDPFTTPLRIIMFLLWSFFSILIHAKFDLNFLGCDLPKYIVLITISMCAFIVYIYLLSNLKFGVYSRLIFEIHIMHEKQVEEVLSHQSLFVAIANGISKINMKCILWFCSSTKVFQVFDIY